MYVSKYILDGSILLHRRMKINYYGDKTPFMPPDFCNAVCVQNLFDHHNKMTVQDLMYLLHQAIDPVEYAHSPPPDPSKWGLYVRTYPTETQPVTWTLFPNNYEVLRIPEYILKHGLLVLSIYPEDANAHHIIIPGEVTLEYLTQIIHDSYRTKIEGCKTRLEEEIKRQRNEVEVMRNRGLLISSEQSYENTKRLQKRANLYENRKAEALHETHGVVF